MLRTTKLISISILPELLEEADRIAKKEHRTRSELFREALRSYITRKDWQHLREYGSGMAKKQGIHEEDVDRLVDEYRHKDA